VSEESAKSPTVDVSTLAKLFNLTAVRVQQLATDGVVIKAARGRYDLWSSIRNYIKFLQERKVNQWGADQGGEYEGHRSRLTKARADMAEVQASLLKGSVHEASAVESVWSDMIGNARTKLLAIPSKLAPRVHGQESLAAIKTELESAVTEALNELATYDPSLVTERYVAAHREALDTPASVDGEPMGGRDAAPIE
jgi:phage terminase Nu1 subunit (DNA packaging protein)